MTEEEDELFRRAMGDLGLARRGSKRGSRDEESPEPRPAAGASGPPSSPGEPGAPGDCVADLDRALFFEAMAALTETPAAEGEEGARRVTPAVPGTSRRRVHGRLKNGTILAERSLDLHGRTRRDAVQLVRVFLGAARADGIAVVKVITGRGLHSSDGALLRDAVLGALEGDLRSHVSEVVRAPRIHGGEGALIVFLRRAAGP